MLSFAATKASFGVFVACGGSNLTISSAARIFVPRSFNVDQFTINPMIFHLTFFRISRYTSINVLFISYAIITRHGMGCVLCLAASIATLAVRMFFQRTNQRTALSVREVRTGLHIHLCRLDVAVPLVICVLAPEDDRHLGGVISLPNCLVGAVFSRHGAGQSNNSRPIQAPSHEGIPRLLGLTHVANGRAIPRIDRLHAVAAVKVEVHQVVIAVVVDLHQRGAVRGNRGLLIQQRIEALVGLRHIGHQAVGQALFGLALNLFVIIIIEVLLIVNDRVIDVRRLVEDSIRYVFTDIRNIDR